MIFLNDVLEQNINQSFYMQPLPHCIHFLSTHSFLRNHSATHLQNINFWKDTNEFIWYCVGIISDTRFVHCIRFLKKSPKPGITSYYIQWYKTAPYSRLQIDEMPTHFESVCFWVHSGVALRKNFFLFEDRMSLIRSTFYYDSISKLFYRMSHLIPYLNICEEIPHHVQIYTNIEKFYCFQKRNKKRKYDENQKKKSDFCKALKKFIEQNNHLQFIRLEYPKLFNESQLIISSNGNSS